MGNSKGATTKPPSALHILYSHYESDPRARRLGAALVEDGWKVTVLCLAHVGASPGDELEGVLIRRYPGARYRGTSVAAYLRSYVLFLRWAMVESLRGGSRYDFVHVHTPPDFAVFAAAPLRLRGARILLDIHDLSPELFEERFGTSKAGLATVVRLIERASVTTAHQVVTVTEEFRSRLAARGIPGEIQIIMNLPDEKIFWRDEIPDPPDHPVLAYHGTLVPRYGPDLLLEAAARLVPDYPDLEVRIIGDGDQRDMLLDRARRSDLQGHVAFSPGRIPLHEIPDHLGGVTAGVVPNRPQGFAGLILSTKLLEYLALGLPAVVTQTAPLDYYFQPGELFTVRDPEPAALERVLREIIEAPAAAFQQVMRARRFFERHPWRLERERYIRLAEELASRRGR